MASGALILKFNLKPWHHIVHTEVALMHLEGRSTWCMQMRYVCSFLNNFACGNKGGVPGYYMYPGSTYVILQSTVLNEKI